MKLKYLFLVTLLMSGPTYAQDNAADASPAAVAFTVESSTFTNGGFLPAITAYNQLGCGGENILPALSWSNPPAGTQGYMITVYDPDAPTVSGFWHWGVYNLGPLATGIAEGANKGNLPDGSIQTITDYGSAGYGGPCPPVGDAPHHYIFTVYALDVVTLPLDPSSTTGAFLMFNARNHIIGEAKIVGLYQRL